MNSFKIISLDSKTTRVKLPQARITKTPEELLNEKKEIYSRIDSNITPFISKISQLKKDDEFVYVYLSFNDYISCEDAQKCMKKISGEEYPLIKVVSEDELSTILKVRTENIDTETYKWRGNYLLSFNILKNEPAGYRIVLKGKKDVLEIFDGRDWKKVLLPEVPFAYVINSTKFKHRVVGDTGRKTLYIRGSLDENLHNQLIQRNLKEYYNYALFENNTY